MAAKKRRPRAVVVDDVPTGPEEQLEQEIIEELTDFLEEFGGTVNRCQVSRILTSGERQYLGNVGTQGLTHESIREAWGAGKYHLRFVAGNHFVKHLMVNIGPAAGQVSSNGAPAPMMGGGDHFMREHMALQQTLLLSLIGAFKPAPPVDVGSILNGVANLRGNQPDATAMVTAIIGAVAPLLVKNGEGGGTDLKKLREVLTLVNEFNPHQKEENMYTAAKDIAGIVVDGATKLIGGMKAPPSQVVQLPAGGDPTRPAKPGEGLPMPPQMTVVDWIRAQLAYMKQKALQNKEPGFWIDYILENEDEPGCASLIRAIEQNATFEQLLQFDPEIAQNPHLLTWFKTVYDGLHTEIKQAMDSARGTGNAGNPTGDASPSPAGGENAELPTVDPTLAKPAGN
jgi:hypothetical protein